MRKKYQVILNDTDVNDARNIIADFPRRYSRYISKCDTPLESKKGHWRIKHIKSENSQIVLALENSAVDISKSKRKSATYTYITLLQSENNVLLEYDFRIHLIDKILCFIFNFLFVALSLIGILYMETFVKTMFFVLVAIVGISVPNFLWISEYFFRKIRNRVFLEILSKNFKIDMFDN